MEKNEVKKRISLFRRCQKKTSKPPQLKDGGTFDSIDITNIIILVIVGSLNIIGILEKGMPISYFVLYVFPLVLFVIIICLFRKYKFVTAIIYYIMAVLSTVLSDNGLNYIGIPLFISSYQIVEIYTQKINKRIYLVFLVVSAMISICIYGVLNNAYLPHTMTALTAFVCIGIIYYILTYQKKAPPKRVKNPALSDQEHELIFLLSEGHSQKTAAVEMGISQSQANEIVKRVRRKTGSKSLLQVMFLAGKFSSKNRV